MVKDPYDIKMSIDGIEVSPGYVPAVARAIVQMERAAVNFQKLMWRLQDQN